MHIVNATKTINNDSLILNFNEFEVFKKKYNNVALAIIKVIPLNIESKRKYSLNHIDRFNCGINNPIKSNNNKADDNIALRLSFNIL